SRPEGIQLALYAHALDAIGEPTVRALAFAQLRAGDIAVAGLTQLRELWPALAVAVEGSRVPARDWGDATAQLRDRLALLARELREGVAGVSPRTATTFRQ